MTVVHLFTGDVVTILAVNWGCSDCILAVFWGCSDYVS